MTAFSEDSRSFGIALPVAALALCLYLLHNAWGYGIRNVPGPWPASLSSVWRMWLVFRGTAHIEYRQLHKKYGNIVRTAPRVVDISDPDAIPIIYGISSKFIKVLSCPTAPTPLSSMQTLNLLFAVSLLSHYGHEL